MVRQRMGALLPSHIIRDSYDDLIGPEQGPVPPSGFGLPGKPPERRLVVHCLRLVRRPASVQALNLGARRPAPSPTAPPLPRHDREDVTPRPAPATEVTPSSRNREGVVIIVSLSHRSIQDPSPNDSIFAAEPLVKSYRKSQTF